MDFKKFSADLAAGYRKLTGHEAGRKAGHNAGRAEGYEAGRKAGHDTGRAEGYEVGRKAGHDEAMTPPEPPPSPEPNQGQLRRRRTRGPTANQSLSTIEPVSATVGLRW